jgi:DinB family protein
MNDAAQSLQIALDEALPRLRALSEDEAGRTRGPGKWTRKEVLGHLIDSALNNHQRFVRAQRVDPLVWPGYEQDAWVALQRYRDRPWTELQDLWSALNRHLVHVMAAVPADRLGVECRIGDDPPTPLGWWMTDYVRHLRHHLGQILEGFA